MAFIKEYKGWTIEATRYSVFAYCAEDDFSAETLDDAEALIDRKRDDEEAEAEWERERARAEAAGRRLDATLAAVDAEVETLK